MASFELTSEQLAIRELAHDFAVGEIRPVAGELDRTEAFPAEIVRKACKVWETGLMNVHVASSYGGPELDDLSSVVIAEELAWGCAGVSTTLGNNELAAGR